MKDRIYLFVLLGLCGGLITTGVVMKAGFSYWVWCTAGVVLYVWCKDVMTAKGWLAKPKRQASSQPNPLREQIPHSSYEEFVAALPLLPNREKEGYVELTKLCVAAEGQPELMAFFETLKDFSQDRDYGTNLNYVMSYLDDRNISFIMQLDWKAPVSELAWRLTASLQENFKTILPHLPGEENYDKRVSVSFDNVFRDFDIPLRKNGLQMGFIDTQSDEYVMVIHKTEDKQAVEQSVAKIGYRYYEV
jgi:hypothetical protein